jgi:hypothetical protein
MTRSERKMLPMHCTHPVYQRISDGSLMCTTCRSLFRDSPELLEDRAANKERSKSNAPHLGEKK